MAASSSTRFFSYRSRVLDLDDALEWASKNRAEVDEAVLSSAVCGCFHCLALVPAVDIVENLPEDPSTVICPRCFVDSIIVDSSDHPVSTRLLVVCKARHFWS